VLFADRDGTLIADTGYPIDPTTIELNYPLITLLQTFSDKISIAIVSNQSGISRGYFSPNAVIDFNLSLVSLLREHSLHVAAIAFCPHVHEDNCHCRKPSSYMISKLIDILDISPGNSFMIGDKHTDCESGMNIGIQSELIKTDQVALRNWLTQ